MCVSGWKAPWIRTRGFWLGRRLISSTNIYTNTRPTIPCHVTKAKLKFETQKYLFCCILAAVLIYKLYLIGKVGKGAALVWEGWVIYDVPVKNIELTVRHGILAKNKKCIYNLLNSKLKLFLLIILLNLLPEFLKWHTLVNNGVKCPIKRLEIETGGSLQYKFYWQNTEKKRKKKNQIIYILSEVVLLSKLEVLWFILTIIRLIVDIG